MKTSGVAKARIVVVGGGAAGLELATRLGDEYGHRGVLDVTLIERNRTHVWKPKLHEIASGSMDMAAHEVDYLAQSHWHGFRYRIGDMIGLDRERREVLVGPHIDSEGREVTPTRTIGYDVLVITVGSQNNDFGTPGVAEYAIKLESQADAKRFHERMVNACIRAHAQASALVEHQLKVAIIGAGATGVELAAQLHRTTRQVIAYGLDKVDAQKDIKITLIEAAKRVLPALPERVSQETERLLREVGVNVLVDAKVSNVAGDRVVLANGDTIPAELIVWAAGIKAPDFLKDIAGLETNRINQLVVRPTLQTTRDDRIFAIGDCSACAWGDRGNVPPRAQAAHQQASHLYKQIPRFLREKSLKDYRYRDFGSLVSLGDYSTVGLMSNLVFAGFFARMMYLSLYKMHEYALHGLAKVTLDTAARVITRRTEPHVKLH